MTAANLDTPRLQGLPKQMGEQGLVMGAVGFALVTADDLAEYDDE